MPTYAYLCKHCESEQDVFCKISEMDDKVPYHCGEKMQRQIQPVYGYVQGECHYTCPVTRQNVTSWKQRKETFAKHNLIDASDMDPAKEIAKQQKRKSEQQTLAASMPHVAD